jgi:TonB-dependent SusC/RagA subfamily outer membrane receptor
MKKNLIVFYLLFVSLSYSYASDDKATAKATVKSVTVYRNGAEITQSAKAQLVQGSCELMIEGISNTIDINSLQINCPSAITILGVEFNNSFLGGEVASPALKKLQDSAVLITMEMEKIDIAISTSEDLLSVLKSNKEIKGSQTGLSVSELMKLMDYYKLKSSELQNELSTLKIRKGKRSIILDKLNSEIEEAQSKNNKKTGRLILQLTSAISGETEFSISYLTPNAFWTPYYDIKIEGVLSPLKLIYKAKISQSTGIDWKKVKLSLSTSTPSQYGVAPLLKSWFLSYNIPINELEKNLSKSNSIPSALQGRVAGVSLKYEGESKIRIRGQNSLSQNAEPMYIVNGAEMSASDAGKLDPNSFKSVNVLKDASATSIYGSRANNGAIVITLKEGLEDYVTVSDKALEVTYDIDLPYDVPTNGKQQIATLKEASVNGVFKFYAVPKLDKDVFLLTEVNDWEKLNLLAGEANIIFEGTYVGKSFIDPATTSDTLNLTLGKDKRVVVKREKLADFSSVKFLGTNKLQTITYELTVKNNKKDPIFFIIKDQYPISTDKEIEVELIDNGGAEINPEIGVLTWSLPLAAGESKKVRLSYSVKYPKGKLLNLN